MDYLNSNDLLQPDDENGTIWTRNLDTADNTDYYTFKEYDMEVSHGDAIETMQKAAGFQSVIYVVEDYTMKAFGCSAEYVSNSDYAYLITEEIDTASDEVFSVLVEMGERMNG